MLTQQIASPEKSHSQTMSVAEALRLQRMDLTVPRKQVVRLDPGDPVFGSSIHSVRITSIRDAQAFGLLPQAIDDKLLLQAWLRDDEAALARLDAQATASGSPCGCDARLAQTRPASARSRARVAYQQTRSADHRHLARLLSAQRQYRLDPNDLYVVNAFWLIRKIVKAPWIIVANLFHDLTIEHGATLMTSTATKLLSARAVRIYDTGRLVVKASHLHLSCDSIQGSIL